MQDDNHEPDFTDHSHLHDQGECQEDCCPWCLDERLDLGGEA